MPLGHISFTSYVTKSHLFGAQPLHQEQQAMSGRINHLATDLRLSEQCTRDYFENKLDEQKQESNVRMDKIRALLVSRSSTSSSYSRRIRPSRHSDDTISGSSTTTSKTHRRAARQDRQANYNPIHGNPTQEQFDEQAHRHRLN